MTAYETALKIIDIAPSHWRDSAEILSTRELAQIVHACDSVAKSAVMVSKYLEMRAGYSCTEGDQGHQLAVKLANKAGRKLWCDTLGYLEFVPINI